MSNSVTENTNQELYTIDDLNLFHTLKINFYEISENGNIILDKDKLKNDGIGNLYHIGHKDSRYCVCYYIKNPYTNNWIEECINGERLALKYLNSKTIIPIDNIDTVKLFDSMNESISHISNDRDIIIKIPNAGFKLNEIRFIRSYIHDNILSIPKWEYIDYKYIEDEWGDKDMYIIIKKNDWAYYVSGFETDKINTLKNEVIYDYSQFLSLITNYNDDFFEN